MSGQDSRSPDQWHKAKIAQIHVAKKQLDMDDDSYRDMLERITGQRSAADLNVGQIRDVLTELRRRGFESSYKCAYKMMRELKHDNRI